MYYIFETIYGHFNLAAKLFSLVMCQHLDKFEKD